MHHIKQFESPRAPEAIGPYSHAILINLSNIKNLIFLSGQIGINPVTKKLDQGIEAQTKHIPFQKHIYSLTQANTNYHNLFLWVIVITILIKKKQRLCSVNKINTILFRKSIRTVNV